MLSRASIISTGHKFERSMPNINKNKHKQLNILKYKQKLTKIPKTKIVYTHIFLLKLVTYLD